jgi:hypothetical protein
MIIGDSPNPPQINQTMRLRTRQRLTAIKATAAWSFATELTARLLSNAIRSEALLQRTVQRRWV